MNEKLDSNCIRELVADISQNNMVSYEELPQYDLFLSQVIDFLNDKFTEEKYTTNIVQNYIKSEVISKPEDSKKRGYTKLHLVQLVLLSYMRPVLTTDEIKKVFSLAFNDINDREDDVISWETAYKMFEHIQEQSIDAMTPLAADEKLDKMIQNFGIEEKDKDRIRTFILIISLVSHASVIKKLVKKVAREYEIE